MPLLAALILPLAVACGGGGASGTDLTSAQPYGGQYAGGSATGDTQEGAAFARWVIE